MGKPYSEDLRERVIGAAQDGATIPEIAEQFGVSISSVVRFRRLHRETGSVSPAKFGGYKGYALAAHEELVRELVAEQSDITLAELKAVLATEKVTVGQSSISRFLHHLNLRFKKSLRAAEQDRPDVAAARKALQKQQPRLDPKRLVFIDETSFTPVLNASAFLLTVISVLSRKLAARISSIRSWLMPLNISALNVPSFSGPSETTVHSNPPSLKR